LEIALEKENLTIAEMLISRGASYELMHPVSNQSLLDEAFQMNKSTLLNFLIRQGINLNRSNRNGLSYINMVANAGNLSAFHALCMPSSLHSST
jgi:ankyrin repeat protein